MPIDFVLFAATLLGVALFHHHTLRVALSGLTAIAAHTVLFSPFRDGAGLAGLAGPSSTSGSSSPAPACCSPGSTCRRSRPTTPDR